MRLSKAYVPTLKEVPADAEVVSHRLLLRGGFVRQLTRGIYTYLPLGLRAVNKVADICREEMNRAGAQEILMPMVQPADLWAETGRWEFYGKELLRFKDRADRDYCLGPTHEEVVTDLVRGEVRSYRQLPINLYQIQTKFRDEIRPRFGLMRGREFVMKDAYSFDRDEAGADASYRAMYDAYCAIFRRLGLEFRPVEADTGSIGGNFSHEFMVLADTGEDTIATCQACEYAANLEKAEAVVPADTCGCGHDCPPASEIPTPGAHTVEELCAFLGVEARVILKTLLFDVDGKPVAALVRGDRELNEIKLKNHLHAQDVKLASPEQVTAWTGAPVGFAGPMGLKAPGIVIVADRELDLDCGWIAGANAGDTHVKNLDLRRDVKVDAYADLRNITEADPCPRCGGAIRLRRGIEVGHVFKLGLKYSKAMNATFLDENGREQVMVMGCYGIGVSRIVASAIEQNHDDDGIKFPPSIAPYEVSLVSLAGKDPEVAQAADDLYEQLVGMGVEVLYDDRDERPGVKFKDADLLGMPMQLVLGGKGLKNGVIEAKDRRTGEKRELKLADFVAEFASWRRTVRQGWGLDIA
ncbi:prolyl-tRNA synthetase [Humidesulfovibrio mexicanus]|uniref:Proline--tRNA ligase n=1 Tax=Humidesulfovibrio mexicanus TaxID=147047 RepID=A0A239CAQ2_9BACT|nr:proline--tRNA ligase [Humidesulfovibrio mexicanus]SNS17305.1 prolyl-tRNA synthetase [Humidesulfovibrio mexicanus]